jgi:hypothetical protein
MDWCRILGHPALALSLVFLLLALSKWICSSIQVKEILVRIIMSFVRLPHAQNVAKCVASGTVCHREQPLFLFGHGVYVSPF